MHAIQRASSVAPVPHLTAHPHPDTHAVQHDDRAGFGALRTELHERNADQDLIELWRELRLPEQRQLLRSAELSVPAAPDIGRLSETERDAVRGAIHRMSRYARRLRERMDSAEPAACQLARNARQAVIENDREAVLHWLKLIETGAA